MARERGNGGGALCSGELAGNELPITARYDRLSISIALILTFSAKSGYPALPSLSDMPAGWPMQTGTTAFHMPGEEAIERAKGLDEAFGGDGE